MYGIEGIGIYIPEDRIENLEKIEKFNIDREFLDEKIGVVKRSIKAANDDTSDLCVSAYHSLINKYKINVEEIDCIIVITQNPDKNIPHTSSVVHKKLEFKKNCACFDVSLGCSGFVYGLSIITSFLQNNSMKKGLLFTADPYSKIIDVEDKNTSLLFGDAATVTLVSQDFIYSPMKFSFGTYGLKGDALTIVDDKLAMNGRDIYNFTSTEVPVNIKDNLQINNLEIEQIDFFALHPGSKYILSTLIRKLKIPENKIDGNISDFGNTVSSSIPIELFKTLNKKFDNIMISGFGVGLSWATSILERRK